MKGMPEYLKRVDDAIRDGCTDRPTLALRLKLSSDQVKVYIHQLRIRFNRDIPRLKRVSSEFAPGFHQ